MARLGRDFGRLLVIFATLLLSVVLMSASGQQYDGRSVDEGHSRQIAVNTQKIEDLDKRVAGYEAAHIPEKLAEIKSTVEYDHAIIIAVGIGILGLLSERILGWKASRKERIAHG